jgi:two-component system CheB/CheR fusion protein
MTEVLRELPEGLGMAIVFIQHLDPKHSSMLTELLARTTSMSVCQVADGMNVEPNRVYVIPPNTSIVIRQGALHIEPRHPANPHMPVDCFFRSLADDQGSRAIGVVLSGTASDGTLGLKAIKEAGGITLAQDPENARYDGMPRSAIVAGCVDSVLSAEGIAAELARLCHHPYLAHTRIVEEPRQSEKAFDEILTMLRVAKGVDFSHYKPGTVRRRTLRRIAIHRMETPEQYLQYLRNNRDEAELLFNDILIHVTSFFREPAAFNAMIADVFPAILKSRSPDDPVRVWVPGCATGEEVYSVAICMLEYMRQSGVDAAIQLFGTDLSELALEQARTGVYPTSIEADVSPERLRRFFVATNGMYQIARSVRDMCIFARQNVTKDPPFSKLDIITCRNLLIYLGQPLQSKVMRLFHYALKPNGYLVLGSSETIGDAGELFAAVDRQHKIYSRKPAPAIITNDFSPYDEHEMHDAVKRPPIISETLDGEKRVDQVILARYAPPAVVIDSAMRVLHFRGDTSRYLQHPPGSANLNLAKLAREGLGVEIRKLLHSEEAKTQTVKSKPISFQSESGRASVTVSIVPMPGSFESQFLVIFESTPSKSETREARKPSEAADRIKDLEEELAGTRRHLHSVIEEQEAATEELKSAHEEMQSSNEELRSTNEELLTAKEELQSTNEELNTVNDEMQSRNAELQQLNNDLINLLSSVNIPIVMLGNDLRIRRFTPHAERILSLLPSDLGRPMSDLRLKINVPDLVDLCQEVVDTLVPKDREVQDADRRLYSMWVRPYRTADHRIDGVVLVLFDITERRHAEARYKRLFETESDGVVIADALTGEIVDANPSVARIFGYSLARLVGVRFWESELFRLSEIDESIRAQLNDTGVLQKSLTLKAVSGEPMPVDVTASLYSEAERKVIQFNLRDMTVRKRIEHELLRTSEALRETRTMETVGRLAGGVAHDFNNILTTVVGYTDLLRRELKDNHPASQLLDEIGKGADRAIALTRQLLAFGRHETAAPQVLDVATVLTETRQILAVLLTRDIDIQIRIHPDTGRLRADRTQLVQVILNLVLNARDAMPEGGAITLEASNVDVDHGDSLLHATLPPGEYVAISVRDTRTGMDSDARLSTVHDTVKESGGYIAASRASGIGATFTVYFPRIDGQPALIASVAPGLAALSGTETILLVEDDHAVRGLAKKFLEISGYTILEAASGPDALRIAREYPGPIHLLITDVVMPRMSGREVALQLASERPDMKILYMSGHTEDTIVHHGVLQPGVEFIQKPFTDRQFLARTRTILDG